MSICVDIEKRLGDFYLKACFEAGDEVIALLGASGCGKSMTLKCIAGIEKPDSGRITVDDTVVFDSEKHINLTPQQRRTGLLFQNYALFPNMTVLQNIQAGARREKDRLRREGLVSSFIDSFGLSKLAGHYPSQLSGGQQQRTALARILVSAPRILLLDEPFSALDSHLRFMLEREVSHVIRRFGKTVVLVSHDRDEVFRLSDRIAVMNHGVVEDFGYRDDVFRSPRTKASAMLTGCKNICAVKKVGDGRVMAVDWGIELDLMGKIENKGFIGIRMHDIVPAEGYGVNGFDGVGNVFGCGVNVFDCKVTEEIENPFSYTLMLEPEGASGSSRIGWEIEDKRYWDSNRKAVVRVALPPRSIMLLE
ncbi:MAG: sulfate/molybdate ABC transporter ATP-binding protein [Sphaerochaetaceae bacterium]